MESHEAPDSDSPDLFSRANPQGSSCDPPEGLSSIYPDSAERNAIDPVGLCPNGA